MHLDALQHFNIFDLSFLKNNRIILPQNSPLALILKVRLSNMLVVRLDAEHLIRDTKIYISVKTGELWDF